MALVSSMILVSDGTLQTVHLTFPFRVKEDVRVYVQGKEVLVNDGWVWSGDNTIRFDTPIPSDVVVWVRRLTDLSSVPHIFGEVSGATGRSEFTYVTVDENFEYILEASQDALDSFEFTRGSVESTREWAELAEANANLALQYANAANTSKQLSEAARLASEAAKVAASNSASAALVSQTSASSSASSASASANTATNAATTATTQAGTATTKANEAKTSASNAAASKIAAEAALDTVLNTTEYLSRRGDYLTYLPKYKGVVNKQERITSPVLKYFLLDIKILNATKGKLYKIESIGVKATDVSGYTHDVTIRIMSTDKDVLDFARIATYIVKVDTNKGVQTFTVKNTQSMAIEFTVDSSFLSSSDVSVFWSFERPDNYRYTWYINPKNYIYNPNELSYNQIPSINTSPNDTPQTFSDKFNTDPRENLLRGLNSPYRYHENGLVRANIPARATFIFPKFDSSQGGMQVYETYPNVTRLNISSIDTTTIAGNLTTQLFVSNWVSAYGIRRFHLLNPEPIHANVHGFLEFLIRVPDETTREVYTASIYTPGTVSAAMINGRQHIGDSSPLGRDEPKTLDISTILGDTIYMQDTTPEIVQEWLSGYWQKVYIPLSGVASFYNGRNYTFSIYRRHVSGTPTTEATIRNTDLVMLNASFSFYYDASPKINHRYHHLLELAK